MAENPHSPNDEPMFKVTYKYSPRDEASQSDPQLNIVDLEQIWETAIKLFPHSEATDFGDFVKEVTAARSFLSLKARPAPPSE